MPQSRRKFPKLLPDGSFCVEVHMSLIGSEDRDFEAKANKWLLEDWMRGNEVWPNTLEPEGVSVFANYFVAAPIFVSRSENDVRLRLLGKPGAKPFWRDRLASKIIPEIKAEFKQLGGVLKIVNCDKE